MEAYRQRFDQIIAFIDARYYRHWAALIGLGLLIGLLEAVAGLLFLGLIAVFNGADLSVRLVEWTRLLGAKVDPVIVMAGLVILVFAVKTIASLAQIYLRATCVDSSAVALSRRLVRNYLTAPYEFHLQRHSGELIRNVGMSIDLISRSVLLGIAIVIGEIFTILGLLLVAMLAAPGATLVTMLLVGAYFAGIAWLTRGRARALGVEQQELSRESFRLLARVFDVIKEVKLHDRADAFAGAYADVRARQAQVLRRYETLSLVPGIGAELVVVGLVAGAGIALATAGNKDPSVLALVGLFAYIAMRLKPSATRVATGINSLKYGLKAVDVISADLRLEPAAAPPAAPVRLTRTLELRDVAYAYPDADRPSLSEVSLTIRRGDAVGVIGVSGSGKSTFAEIVLGLLRPSAGEVLVDGEPVDCSSKAWQAGVGYVPQTIALLDDTIRRNIAFGLPDEEIDEARVLEVVRIAQLGDVIAVAERGLDTMLGELGAGLSGGQRQRVAIARALYRNPQLLVFDEATSGLDHETEAEVARAIEALRGGVTMIVIAHRSAALRGCNRVVRFAGGRLVGVESSDDRRELASLEAGRG